MLWKQMEYLIAIYSESGPPPIWGLVFVDLCSKNFTICEFVILQHV